MVVARFQCDDRAPSAGAVTRGIECLGFGVRLALAFVVALADELPAGIEDYASQPAGWGWSWRARTRRVRWLAACRHVRELMPFS